MIQPPEERAAAAVVEWFGRHSDEKRFSISYGEHSEWVRAGEDQEQDDPDDNDVWMYISHVLVKELAPIIREEMAK